jgi:hypothetical protein
MVKIRQLLVMTLLVGSQLSAFAYRLIENLTRERVERDFPVKVITNVLTDGNIGVSIHVSPRAELMNFVHAELDIVSGGRNLVHAVLKPTRESEELIIVSFTGQRQWLQFSEITLIVDSKRKGADGFKICLREFLK